jgi:hypothetical protein
MSFNVDFNRYQPDYIDPYITSKNFCDLYYGAMALKVFSGVSYMFNTYAQCNYNGTEYIGLHNVAMAISSEGIMRLTYNNLMYSCSVIDNNTMIIQVTGLCQGITFWGSTTPVYSFTETFVLRYDNVSILVNNYLFRIL